MPHRSTRLAVSVVLGVVLICLVALPFLLVPPLEEADIEWRKHWTEDGDPLSLFPERETNEAARRIESLAAQIGLEFTPVDGRVAPARGDPKAQISDPGDALRDYFHALRQSTSGLLPLPPEVEGWLGESLPVLAEMASVIENDAPEWQLDLSEGITLTQPHLLGHLQLHRSFVVAAVASLGEADRSKAECWLAAARALRGPMARDPLILHQLVALTEHKDFLTALRVADPPPAEWRQWSRSLPWREQIHRALRLESWLLLQGVKNGTLEASAVEEIEFLPRWLVVLMLRAAAVQSVESMERSVERLGILDLRAFDKKRFFDEEMTRIPRWNLIARIVFPNLFESAVKAARVELDHDLTFHMLELRERLARCGEGKLELSEVQPSPVRGINWIFSAGEDSLEIRASDVLPPTGSQTLPLSVRLELPAPCVVYFT